MDRDTLLKRLLAAEAHPVPAGQTAVPSLRALERLASELTYLLGSQGFQSVLVRAVQLALPDVPGLHALRSVATLDEAFGLLRADLGAMAAERADAAGRSVCGHLCDVLAGMIGVPLLDQILRSAAARAGSGQALGSGTGSLAVTVTGTVSGTGASAGTSGRTGDSSLLGAKPP